MLPSVGLTPRKSVWIAWSSLLLLCVISLNRRAATASLSLSGAVSPDLTFEAVESAFGSRSILTSSARVASLKVDQSVPDLRLALLCSGAGRVHMGPFSAGVPVIPAEISVIPTLRRRPLNYPSTAPASERGPAPSLPLCRRPCLSQVSGQPGPIRAAWALPKRDPARGRGRETELFKGLRSAAGISLHSALASVPNSARLPPRIKCGAGRDKRGNDGILTQQMADLNTPLVQFLATRRFVKSAREPIRPCRRLRIRDARLSP